MHIHTAARSLGSTFLFVEPTLWESESLLQSIQVSMDTSEPGWYPGDGHEHANEENTKAFGGCHIISWWGSAAKSSWWIHLMMKKVSMIMCFMVKCSVCQHMDLFKSPFINPCIEYSLLKHWFTCPSHCSLSLHSLFPYPPTAHQSGQGPFTTERRIFVLSPNLALTKPYHNRDYFLLQVVLHSQLWPKILSRTRESFIF